MILFEYLCRSCNQTIQEFHPLGKAPDTTVCDCNAVAKRLPSRGAFSTFPGSYNATK